MASSADSAERIDLRLSGYVLMNGPFSDEIEERLAILVRVADLLGIDDVSFSSYSNAITRLSTQKLNLARSVNRLKFVEQQLRAHLASAQHEENLINRWTEIMQTEFSNRESPEAIARRRDALLKKAREYHAELESLTAEMQTNEPSVSVTDLIKQQERNQQKEAELKMKRAKIKAFKGLPPNLELARHELQNAQKEQMKLIQLREKILANMAHSVA